MAKKAQNNKLKQKQGKKKKTTLCKHLSDREFFYVYKASS